MTVMNCSGDKKGNVYVHPATIDFYAEQTWTFAKSILWNNLPLSPEEIELSLHYIRQYYQALSPERFIRLATNHFARYCKRIITMKRFAESHPAYSPPHPCMWLNPANPKGFNRSSEPGVKKNRSVRKAKS